MRINQLDLSRYGKFTDAKLAMPLAKRDFHVIVGANEAGKSTTRDAILDLLFGIETRSQYDFLHPKTELCLGGSISHGDMSLDFKRVKKAKSLLDKTGVPLSELSLSRYIGGVDRNFFDNMFGLDHDRLVSGGNEILKASNDIGRILFESAAGVGSLGPVRDALASEADGIWARRKSNERTYYIAADEFAKAETSLKLATVKTRDWSDAQTRVDVLQLDLANITNSFRTLEAERLRLERIRRVASSVRSYHEKLQALADLGSIALLPETAAETLEKSEVEIALAETEQKMAQSLADEAREKSKAIDVDDTILGYAERINALTECAQQTRFHERDIGKLEIEINGHWQRIRDAVEQLGWSAADEAEVLALMPSVPVRSAIANLTKNHGAIEQKRMTCDDLVRTKNRELSVLIEQIEKLENIKVSPELRVSLEAGLRLGDYADLSKQYLIDLAKAKRELHSAETKLGKWKFDLVLLSKLVLPPVEAVKELRSDFDRLTSDRRIRSDRLAAINAELNVLALEIEQLRKFRHAITFDDLVASRVERDSMWSIIKTGATPISENVLEYEAAIADADEMSDLRHDKAQEAAELQEKLNTQSRMEQQVGDLKNHQDEADIEIARVEETWKTVASTLGFPNMPLIAYEEWRAAHTEVTMALETDTQITLESEKYAGTIKDVTGRLHHALVSSGIIPAQTEDLAILIELAKTSVDIATNSAARLEELHRQKSSTKIALEEANENLINADSAEREWKELRTKTLSISALSPDLDIGAIEEALLSINSIDARLKAIHDIRTSRIELMRGEIEEFEQQAKSLATATAKDLAGLKGIDVAANLANRLLKTQNDQQERERLEIDFQRFAEQCTDTQKIVDSAESRLAPFFGISGVRTRNELRDVIGRSDAYRLLKSEKENARTAAESSGDGLGVDELSLEIGSEDLAKITVRVSEIAIELESARSRLGDLSSELTIAKLSLNKIAGNDDAACAESARQDALAKMADAVERYIKVHTAGKLLRWAIDRYRETKQGPMLARASDIFSGLTCGSFDRLVVDFESDPPKLDAMRGDGKTVGIAGMSDGTRDQLFLALRLAALEMHVEKAQALPFIADDLFINYDDERSKAGIEALATLSESTQVIFLTHHKHLLPTIKSVLGDSVNVIEM